MKVFEYARENNITSKEAKELFGLKSHLSVIPDVVVEAVKEPEPEPVVEPVAEQEEALDLKAIELSIRCLGNKSKLWKHHKLVGK